MFSIPPFFADGQVGYCLVNIHVEDTNDNAPFFLPAEYDVSIREDITPGSAVLVLSAKDADEGAYGQVSIASKDCNRDLSSSFFPFFNLSRILIFITTFLVNMPWRYCCSETTHNQK